jgi:hypothetical protein
VEELYNIDFFSDVLYLGSKIKNRQMELHQNKKLLHDKEKNIKVRDNLSTGRTYISDIHLIILYVWPKR